MKPQSQNNPLEQHFRHHQLLHINGFLLFHYSRYKKENEWLKQNFKRFEVRIEKEKAEEFIKKINKPFATWAKEKIEEELKKR